jgi:flagella basal body P-ring formation protein FlgA
MSKPQTDSISGSAGGPPASLQPNGARTSRLRSFGSGTVLHRILVIGCWMLLASPALAGEVSPVTPPATLAATNTVLDEAVVTRLFTAALQEQFPTANGELAVRFTRPWASKNAPAGPITLKILEMPNSGLASSFIARIELFAPDGTSLGNWQVPMQAHLWREIHVARSMLKPGEPLAGADIALERRDVLALRAPLAEFAVGDAALEIAESVPAGSPLFARSVKLRPVIHRGELTTARIEDGALIVTMKAQALEDGVPGQIIRLRNLQSSRDFSGKVLNEKTVLVSL